MTHPPFDLLHIADDASGWRSLFRDTSSGELWERTYPNGTIHGAGEPLFTLINADRARADYGLEFTAHAGVAEPDAAFTQAPERPAGTSELESVWTFEAVAAVERAEAELAGGGGLPHSEVMRRTREMLGR